MLNKMLDLFKGKNSINYIVITIILFSCDSSLSRKKTDDHDNFDDSLTIYRKINSKISNSSNLSLAYFDSLENQYPYSDFIVGMKAYFYIQNDSIGYANQFLNKKQKVTKFKVGSYSMFAQGVILLKKERLDSAISFFRRSLELNNDNKWVYLELGNSYIHKKDTNKALNYFNQSLEIDSHFKYTKLEKASLYNPKKECQKIIDEIGDIKIDFFKYNGLNYLANAYLECGEYMSAYKYFKKSIQRKKNINAFYGIATIEHYDIKDYSKANDSYSNCLKIDSLDTPCLIGKAWLMYDNYKIEKAEKYFLKALKNKRKAKIFNEVLIFYLNTKQFNKAKKLNIEYKKQLGDNYYNDGFKIILQMANKDLKSDQIDSASDKYLKKYGRSKQQWLVNIAENITN